MIERPEQLPPRPIEAEVIIMVRVGDVTRTFTSEGKTTDDPKYLADGLLTSARFSANDWISRSRADFRDPGA